MDLDELGLAETARQVRQLGRQVLTRRGDVRLKAEVEELLAAAQAELGRVDVVVANAGVVEPDTDCLGFSEELWDRTIDTNLKGTFFTLQAGANALVKQGRGGRLIALSSVMADWGSATTPAYCASKAGIVQLVKSFAMRCGMHGISCNAIAPGLIETQMTAVIHKIPGFAEALADRTPMGRIGQPDDVAAVATFLASDEASFVSGAVLCSDGAMTVGNYSTRMLQARMAPPAAASGS